MIVDYKHSTYPPIPELPTTTHVLVPGPTNSLAPSPTDVAPIPTVHPEPGYEAQVSGESGHRTLWVVFVIMLLSTVAFTVLAYRVPVQKRFFHIITAFITLFATVSYFAMATGDGIALHTIKEWQHHSHGIPSVHHVVQREVYWARYVDWSITTPLLLIDLSFLAGLNGASLLITIVADLFMVLTGLFAGFGHTDGQKWGYYAMACVAYLVIVYQLGVNGRAALQNKDQKTVGLFTSLAGFTLLLWTAYPIVWGVADGAQIANVDSEIIAYAVLDVLAKPVFGFWLLLSHDFSSATSISIDGFWAHGASADGAIRIGADDDEGA